MTQRIVLGALSIVVILGLVMLDAGVTIRLTGRAGLLPDLFRRGSVLPLAILVTMLMAARELDRLLRARGANPYSRFAYVIIAALLLSPWLSASGWLGSKPAYVEGLYWQVVWLIAAVVGTGVLAVLRREPHESLRDSGATMLLILYLGFSVSFALQIRCGRGSAGPAGAWLLLMTILVTKASDIGAYLVGSVFGRHKLIPSISPGKSVEGTLAGLLTSALVGMMFASGNQLIVMFQGTSDGHPPGSFADSGILLLTEAARSCNLNPEANGASSAMRGFILGLCLSFAGQIGDLFESCFKRDAGAKDSGRVMPKFGGILDLIDSPVLALPVAWFLLTAVWGVL